MKVTAEIDVTSSLYFRHLCNGVIKDIKKATGKTVNLKDLMDGYSYCHSLSLKDKKISIKFTVGPLIIDKYFQVKYETNETKCLYYYDFTSDGERTYVTYFEENVYSHDTLGNRLSDMKRNFKKKALANKILNNIELTTTYIKNHEM
ncbi:DUF3284 domain-containing protein [uncultured Traorella sp.]|uniref:DUF3284 domain-containing protein n=1 Tax=uncultured Traorella sp. TaxID=1929048 RepID=UPI0025E0E7B5|nr:DUF3284 domain-containing protein [uncultured Traorella sp.]